LTPHSHHQEHDALGNTIPLVSTTN